jgi:hypothetical protein
MKLDHLKDESEEGGSGGLSVFKLPLINTLSTHIFYSTVLLFSRNNNTQYCVKKVDSCFGRDF